MVDVADVPKGRESGCLCPSCRTPLIARQGDVREWHFAHASRGVYRQTSTDCRYSFYVSVRLMARQLVGSELAIALPAFRDRVCLAVSRGGIELSESFTVTEARTIVLSDVVAEPVFSKTPVDLLGRIKGFSFVLYFTHPERDVPPALETPEDRQCGIVAVDLTAMPERFATARSEGRSYRDVLVDLLSHDIASKRWIYHPRYADERARAQVVLEQRARELAKSIASDDGSRFGRGYQGDRSRPAVTSIMLPTAPTKHMAEFECVVCGATWQDLYPGAPTCPTCKTHLYARLRRRD